MFMNLKALLMADDTVTGIVDDRIYPDLVPSGKDLPAISMFQVSALYSDLADGTRLATSSNWQINCISGTRMASNQLADAVYQALHGNSHQSIKSVVITNRNDDPPGSGEQIRRTILDVQIKHY